MPDRSFEFNTHPSSPIEKTQSHIRQQEISPLFSSFFETPAAVLGTATGRGNAITVRSLL
ncbi:hypothetical protein EVA_06816 [gut metagenome]|uniref:Uncharacterized protein n=1 Tax=gut metagenome TaxID=749906 RepID=J9GRD9_9ZZZZ